jgi:hypothetical protein
MQCFDYIFAQNGIGFDKKLLYRFGNFLDVNPPQSISDFLFHHE